MPQIPPVSLTTNDGRGSNQPNPVPPNTPRLDSRERIFEEDEFLPPTEPDRIQLIPRPAIDMASSVDSRTLEDIRSAGQFQSWLLGQVVVWKAYLNDPNAKEDRRSEFFQNARSALAQTAMNPQERAKAHDAFRKAENQLDQ